MSRWLFYVLVGGSAPRLRSMAVFARLTARLYYLARPTKTAMLRRLICAILKRHNKIQHTERAMHHLVCLRYK